jgi:hypothetical protein
MIGFSTAPFRVAFPLLLGLFLLLLGGPAHALSNEEQLKALNDTARAVYAAGKAETLSHRGPIIIVGSDIVLMANGSETRANYTPDSYTSLKTMSHIALGTVGLLQAYLDDPAGGASKWRPYLEKLEVQTKAVEPILDTLGLGDDALARDRFIVQHLLAFMDSVLQKGSYTREELTAAGHEVAPFLLANAAAAARDQIDLLDSIVQKWRAGMTPDEWNNIRVFVLGPRMPRNGYLQFNYFRFLMGDDAVDKRLIYGENIFDDDGAIALLGTILTDRSIAAIVFDDEMRMDRDFLADGAQAYLMERFGKLGKATP